MKINIIRKYMKESYTIGDMIIDGRWFCNTLEPERGTPFEAVTSCSGKAIPPGTYNIKMRYSPKFKRMLPLVYSPGRTDNKVVSPNYRRGCRTNILIHAGNTSADTQGCILVGKNLRVGKVLQSRATLEALLKKISASTAKGEPVELTITYDL